MTYSAYELIDQISSAQVDARSAAAATSYTTGRDLTAGGDPQMRRHSRSKGSGMLRATPISEDFSRPYSLYIFHGAVEVSMVAHGGAQQIRALR